MSLRFLSTIAAIAFAALVLGLVASSWMASSVVWRVAGEVNRDLEAADQIARVERALRESHRINNLWIATRDPSLTDLRSSVDGELRDLLVGLDGFGVRFGTRLAGDTHDAVTAYFRARDALDVPGARLEQVAPALRTTFEQALSSTARLRGVNEQQLAASKAQAAGALRFERTVTVAITLLLTLGLVITTVGARRFVLAPLFELQRALEGFRLGEPAAKARPGALRETRELAERFNEMTETIAQQRRDQLSFLAAVAHDLRNPLAGLKMIVQALEREPGASTPTKFRRLDRQIDRLSRMVDDLLDATRIEAGHLELRPETFDLREAAQAVVEVYAPTTSTHEIILRAPERPVTVHGDPLRIEQVISNLVSNAIKYAPGGGRVEVTLTATDGAAELAVSDQGVGIPPDEVPNLFTPFRRRSATANVAPGVGLGLSIVRRIVHAHGGHIRVDSEVGRGSTFRVRLPRGTGPDLEDAPPSTPAA